MTRQVYIHQACDNCKYFKMYFYRHSYTYWIATGSGECLIRQYTEEERAKLPYGFVCDRWQREEQRDIEKQQIRTELINIMATIKELIRRLSK